MSPKEIRAQQVPQALRAPKAFRGIRVPKVHKVQRDLPDHKAPQARTGKSGFLVRVLRQEVQVPLVTGIRTPPPAMFMKKPALQPGLCATTSKARRVIQVLRDPRGFRVILDLRVLKVSKVKLVLLARKGRPATQVLRDLLVLMVRSGIAGRAFLLEPWVPWETSTSMMPMAASTRRRELPPGP